MTLESRQSKSENDPLYVAINSARVCLERYRVSRNPGLVATALRELDDAVGELFGSVEKVDAEQTELTGSYEVCKNPLDLERDERLWRTLSPSGGWVMRAEANKLLDIAEAEVERLREALAFYAEPTNYEWREVTDAEAREYDWSDEDRAMAHSSSVLLDEGKRAREASNASVEVVE